MYDECTICQHYAGLDADRFCLALTGHHPTCPQLTTRELAQAARLLVDELVTGIETWAADEDGVTEDLWPAYVRAKHSQGQLPRHCPDCGHRWFGDDRTCSECGNAEHTQTCRGCGCTDNNCQQCVAKTGRPCHWVAEDLCSACTCGTASSKLPEDAAAPWTRNDQLTQSCLLLAQVEVPLTTIATWTDAECQAAEEWAGSVHFVASDNDGTVGIMPHCVLQVVLAARAAGKDGG